MIVFFLLLLHKVFISSAPLEHFKHVTYPVGTSEYTYQFSGFSEHEEGNFLFYFNFTNKEKVQLHIVYENNTTKKITLGTNCWTGIAFSNLNPKIYTFRVINGGQTPGEMIFIDSTKEINTDLYTFINLNFSSTNTGTLLPLPLIFSIDPLEEDILCNVVPQKINYPIYGSDYLLNYCVVDENENKCEYIGTNALSFKQGKKYKIKLNFFEKENKNFIFLEFKYKLYYFKEFNDCYMEYEANGDGKAQYIIANSNNYAWIYFFINPGSDRNNFYYEKITIAQKNELIIEDLKFNNEGKAGSVININMKGYYYIVLRIDNNGGEIYKNIIYKYVEYIKISNDFYSFSISLNKGECALIYVLSFTYGVRRKYAIISSDSNIGKIDKKSYSPTQSYTNIILLGDYINYSTNYLVNSYKKQSICKGYTYKNEEGYEDGYVYFYSTLYFNFLFNNNLTDYLNKYQTDFTFKRFNNYNYESGFNTSYFFDINEDYYLYIKKYYGNSAVYKYSQEMDAMINLTQFQKPYFSYENSKKYELINNKLLIISGYQLFTFIMNYNSLYDIYFQKVNDCEFIQLNQALFPTNNLVKLFSENKYYYLNFTLDHLIKLDSNFLDAKVIFIDENGVNYFLNKDNKIIKDLKGNNIKLITDKKALLYFYYRIQNYTEKGTIIFDKSKKGKNLYFNIKNDEAILIKDICFKGYYPMLINQSWNTLNDYSVDVDNIIDSLEYDLYEGENYIIYIFDSYDENNIPILIDNEIIEFGYYDDLLTPRNKYNFEVIPKNSKGSIILNLFKKFCFGYQFIICGNEKGSLYFHYSYSKNSHNIDIESYSIMMNDGMYYVCPEKEEIIYHSFSSDYEFLFSYNLKNIGESEYSKSDYKSEIIYLKEVSKKYSKNRI